MFKIPILLLISLIVSCSKGGGGGKSPSKVAPVYTIVYIYPENTLTPGQGSQEVPPSAAKCLSNGSEVDPSLCQGLDLNDLSSSPKATQLSPAGDASVVIDNSEEGSITVTFAAGEKWEDLPSEVKKDKAETKVTCSSGFDFTFRGSCEVFVPEFKYGAWPVNDLAPCTVSRSVSRTHECISNITGLTTNINDCSSLTPDISLTQFSPQGTGQITLLNGDTVTLTCAIGKGEDGLVGGESTIVSSQSCGTDRHMVSGSCTDDTFVPLAYEYEDLNLQPGQGTQLANAIAVTSCQRQHSSESVDVSKCSIPVVVPQTSVASPAGTIQVTIDDASGPVTVSVAAGTTWADTSLEDKMIQLSGNVVCNSGMQLAHTAVCLTPSFTAVLGNYPSNPLASCEGETTIYHNYQCLYNITGTLENSSNCANTSTGMTVQSPAGIKNNVTLANGDDVNLLCALGGTPATIGVDASVLAYNSCGTDRYMSSSTCIPEVFTISIYGFTTPTLAVGDGTTEVAATSITECRRGSDNAVVASGKCTLPSFQDRPTRTFSSPAGTLSGRLNNYGDTVDFAVAEGEVFNNATSSQSFLHTCSQLRVVDTDPTRCRYLNVTKVSFPLNGTSDVAITYDHGGSVFMSTLYVASVNNSNVHGAWMGTSNKGMGRTGGFIHTIDNRLIFTANAGQPTIITDVIKFFETDLGIIAVGANNRGRWYDDGGYAGSSDVALGTKDFTNITHAYCAYTSSDYGNGCVFVDNAKALTTLGVNLLVTWDRTSQYGVAEPINIVNIAPQAVGYKEFYHVDTDYFVILRTNGTVLKTGRKNTINGSGVSTPANGTVPAVMASGVDTITKSAYGLMVKKTDGSVYSWDSLTPVQQMTGIGAGVIKDMRNRFVLFSDGTLITKSPMDASVPTTGIREVFENGNDHFILTNDNRYFIVTSYLTVKSGTFTDYAYSKSLNYIFIKNEAGTWVTAHRDGLTPSTSILPSNATWGKWFNPSSLAP